MLDPASAPKTSVRPYILMALLILAVMFGGIGTWAAIVPLEGAVIATGVVAPHPGRQALRHPEGGALAEVLVRNGDHVETGQLLARLDDGGATASRAMLDGRLARLRVREANLEAELAASKRRESATPEAKGRGRATTGDSPDGEDGRISKGRGALWDRLGILADRVALLEEQIGGLQVQQKAKAGEIASLREEIAALESSDDPGRGSTARLFDLQRSVEVLKGEGGALRADIARVRQSIGEAELQTIQANEAFRADVVGELRAVQAEIFDLDARRIVAAGVSRRAALRAPRAGTVTGLEAHAVGAAVGPGEAILEIVPEDEELVIESRVAPQDVDKVALGLEAIVRLSAFDLPITPEVSGTVFAVSADRRVDQVSGEPYFLVGLRIPEHERRKLDDLALIPGMPSEVFIKTGERTALSYLIKPLSDGLARAFKDD